MCTHIPHVRAPVLCDEIARCVQLQAASKHKTICCFKNAVRREVTRLRPSLCRSAATEAMQDTDAVCGL